MKNKMLILVFICLPFFAAWGQEGVKMEKKPLTLPTYEIGSPDLNPVFFTGRTYQGAQGHIYPYPLFDILTDNKVDKSYEALYVENEYLNVCVVPELGGRILSATDKSNGYEFFYRQTGIKPALIGMLGAWLSGGVEWNFPHHHRPSSFMDIDYQLEENADGSKTIWVGETELRHRIKWSIGVTLHPGRSYVEAKVRIMNRSPYIQSLLYWANVSVHCGPDYEVIFQPSTQFGTDHSKVAFTTWPLGEIVRGSGEKVELAWWKNFTAGSRSIFAWNFNDDFFAGYDHRKQAGTMHVANRHIVNGKKFFLWGNNPSAQMWDKMLSDNDGPYLELMVGAYSDNQPDYSWIGPGETREFSQFWYPIRNIEGAKNANCDAAVNLERTAPDKVFFGFNTTAPFKNAKAVLKSGNKTLFEQSINIDPTQPFVKEINIPSETDDYGLFAALYDSNGKELVSYQPVQMKEQPMPDVVETAKPAEEYKTVEELYQTGLRIEQFYNARLNPMDYYNEALKRDSLDSRVNTVVGIHYARQGKWALAEKHFLAAIERETKNYTITKDPEAYYNLGVVYQMQNRFKEASDCFWKATWYPTFQSPAYFALAQMECVKGDYAEALDLINSSLNVNVRNTKAITVKAYILRKLGKNSEASDLLKTVLAIDPLDYWSLSEASIIAGNGAAFLVNENLTRGAGIVKQQELLELAVDYGNLGAYNEALGLLKESVNLGAPYANFPLIYYYAGYYSFLKGDKDTALSYFKQAGAQPSDYCYPFRLEELRMFDITTSENPSDAKAYFYKGELLYYLEQKEEAIDAWEKSAQLDPRFGLVNRNLGFAYGRANEPDKAISWYEKSIQVAPNNPRAFTEIDQLYQKTGKPAKERLAMLQKNINTVLKHDDAVIRLLGLYNETDDYDKAIKILDTRHFHVWEGGGEVHDIFVDAHLLKGLSLAKNKKYDEAIKEYAIADTYPDNLEVGRPDNGGQYSKIYYYMGKAYAAKGDNVKAKESFEKSIVDPDGRFARGLNRRSYFSEQDLYRAMAYQELGEKAKANEIIDACKKYIDDQFTNKSLIDEYSKFGEDGTQSQRLAQLFYLNGLVYYAQGNKVKADEEFAKAVKANQNMIWPKQFR
jgi:tetratricopeptide (TPR) repeat protein